MYTFEPLTLAHKQLVEERLKKRNICLSEYHFANLYLFRKVHRYEVALGQMCFIRGVTYDGARYFLPLDPLIEDLSFYRELIDKEQVQLYPLSDQEVAPFKREGFVVEEREDDRDYLYHVDKLREYGGRNLAGRRNLVKQFEDNTPHHVEQLTVENRQMALSVLRELVRTQDDFDECKEALLLLDELSLEGLIVFTGDKPIAFIIGSPLSSRCYLFQFAKALIEYKGVVQFLYQTFARSLAIDSIHWIDLEQDKGVPGLRQAKRAYEPDWMGKKWRVR